MAVLQDAHSHHTRILPPITVLQTNEPPIQHSHGSATSIATHTNTDIQEFPTPTPIAPTTHHLPSPPQGTMKATARIMQNKWTLHHTATPRVRVHVDGGANRSITNDHAALIHFKNIKKYPMAGVAAGEPALVCTGMGYLPWQADDMSVVLVKCYYSSDAAETIISPTDIVINNFSDFRAWSQHSNIETKQGYIEFHNRHANTSVKFRLTMDNGLWYYQNHHDITDYRTSCPSIRRLTKALEYQLYHYRWGCMGQRNSSGIHHHVDHQPKLHVPPLFQCLTCMMATGDYRDITTPDDEVRIAKFDDWFRDEDASLDLNCTPGQHFHVDFGFMRGSGYSKKDDDGQIITSIDGYRAYFIVIDRKTRYLWVFLTKNKKPPLQIFKQFLQEHGNPSANNRTVRSDKGKELWGSDAFKQVVQEAGYIMEPTAPDAPFQNGRVENPNGTLAKTVRCLLYNAGLGPEFWSFALLHAVYLKNRKPHCTTNEVPLTAYSGQRPNAKRLKIFGCPIVVRNLGKRPFKLDLHTSAGTFLGYCATDKNIVYLDNVTNRFKTATHVVFDEAGMTLPKAALYPAAKVLQELGYGHDDIEHTQEGADGENIDLTTTQTAEVLTSSPSVVAENQPLEDAGDLKVRFLSVNATMPTRATDGSVGYDLYSAVDVVIQPNTRCSVPLDISITPPSGTYGQIFSRSGLALKHNVDTCAGVIDPDYTGNIHVLLDNSGSAPFNIRIGDRIAQLLILQAKTPNISQIDHQQDTSRGDNGFGSTGTATVRNNIATTPSVEQTSDTSNAPPVERPFSLYFSTDPFDDTMEIDVAIKGDHTTLGILTEYCDCRQRLRIKDMALSTPGSRLKKWRSVLRNTYILKFNDFAIQSQDDFEHAIRQTRLRKMMKAKLVVATDKTYGVHPMEGVLQLHFDQMNVIAKHLQDIDRDRELQRLQTLPTPTTNTIRTLATDTTQHSNDIASERPAPEPPPSIAPIPPADSELAQSFTKRQLLKRDDWPDWERSQYKQLDQYWDQGMFSEPLPLPHNANALHMLWRFNLKVCSTKKSRMVCNGSPHQKGTVTIGHTYANALDAASERLFWAIVAGENLIAVGADVSNAFAEAPGPKAPLYMYIDDTFRQWWTKHKGYAPIPTDCNVVRVHNAIQGHPESPRLWEKHIDKILRDLGLKPATHEPCFYSGTFDGKRVLFLRQVDDFAVAAADKNTAMDLITAINAKMRIEVKHLGRIDRFNGMDIHQTRHFVKITCEKYLHKMIKGHADLLQHVPINPVPLPADNNYIKSLETATVPTTIPEKLQLKQEMGFNYRQLIGEIIFPMMKCRPEIAPHGIKLSQYMENPAREHYQAIRDILSYLSKTIDDGIYYWRKTPRMDLPDVALPTIHQDNYLMEDNTPNDGDLYGYTDSDWATDTVHRKSISGIVIMFAGGAVGYKCKYQDVIAHSSTEAEFTAACDAGKMILFFRSILADLGLEQKNATVLYEDNNGALMMANAQQPTRRTRHMDIKKFALLDWVEEDLIILRSIKTAENAADGMTKPLAKQLFQRHSDTILGRRVPDYVKRSNKELRWDIK